MTKNQIINRVEELNKASEAYYNTGQPVMSDAEFDNKLEELRQWEEDKCRCKWSISNIKEGNS